MSDELRFTERFLRPTGPGTFDVYGDGELIGTVSRTVLGFKARTANGHVPMPNGSVLSTDDGGRPLTFEKRKEPVHATAEDAAKMIVLAVETSRIINAQVAYERAHGWSTD